MVRVKYRYIVSELVTDKHQHLIKLPVKEKDIKNTVLDMVNEIHGDFGVSCILAGFSIKLFNPVTRIVIFRARRQHHNILSTALPLITAVGKMKLIMRTLKLSGTIRSASKFIIAYDNAKLIDMVHQLQIAPNMEKELKELLENCHHRLAKKKLDMH
uniref:Ribonuclease P/MRP protein subunit POP5 n=1 Tax=Parasteatoda tepidariorum TaxID=114398 RepID=A0A2L2YIW8_PARTP